MVKATLRFSTICVTAAALCFGLAQSSLAQFSTVFESGTPGISRSLSVPNNGRFDGYGHYIQTQPYYPQYRDPSSSRQVIINNGGVNCNYCQTGRAQPSYYPNHYSGGYHNGNYGYGHYGYGNHYRDGLQQF